MTKERRRILIISLQFIISGGMMFGVFFFVLRGNDTQLSDLIKGWDQDSPLWILLALGFTAFSYSAATYRWQKISETLSVRQPYRRMLSHFLSGQFVSSFLPSSIGGDFLRAARLAKNTQNRQHSFASVIIDRFFGWPVLGALSLIGFGLSPFFDSGLFNNGPKTAISAIVVSSLPITAFLVLTWFATHNITSKKLANSKGFMRYITAINIGLVALRENPKKALEVIGVTFVMQTSMVLAGICALQALNIHEIPLLAILAFLPPVLIVQVLPISIGGFGIRESALILAFNVFATNAGDLKVEALKFGLMLAVLNIIVGLFGAPSFIFGGTKSFSPKEISEERRHEKEEIEEIQHAMDEAVPEITVKEKTPDH